jgi:hypothetical protein
VIVKFLATKVVFLKPSILAADTTYYYQNEKKNFYGYSPHFHVDANTLKNVLFGYCMNKL